MNSKQAERLRDVIGLLQDETERVTKLRENPGHTKGRARHTEITCNLSILEVTLGFAVQGLQELMGEQEIGPPPGATGRRPTCGNN